MTQTADYPGTPQHQSLLRAIVGHYRDDPRIRAIAAYGSVVRGDWDALSDLDLLVITTDDVQIDLPSEIQQLGGLLADLGDPVGCAAIDAPFGIDLVLYSLMEVSLRFHPLRLTDPTTVESLRVIFGDLSPEEITEAGRANGELGGQIPAGGIDQFLMLAVGVDVGLQRGNLWRSVQLLQLMLAQVVSAFTILRGGLRPFYFFDQHAPPELKAAVGAALPGGSLSSAQAALRAMLDLIEHHLELLSNGYLNLSEGQRVIISQIRRRQAALAPADGRAADTRPDIS